MFLRPASQYLSWHNVYLKYMFHSDIIVVQLLSHVHFFATPWTAACHTSLSFTISGSLFKLMFIEFESVMHPTISSSVTLFSSFPQSFPASGFFPLKSARHISWPKYWRFSFSISLFSEYSGLMSFRTDWFDLLAVQGAVKSLLQHHNLKASILLSTQPSLWSNSHICTWLLDKP